MPNGRGEVEFELFEVELREVGTFVTTAVTTAEVKVLPPLVNNIELVTRLVTCVSPDPRAPSPTFKLFFPEVPKLTPTPTPTPIKIIKKIEAPTMIHFFFLHHFALIPSSSAESGIS